jgi:hypothetical protein
VNTSLLNIVRRIVAEQGEGILGDPQRLKAFFSDLARDEPKPLRLAFGRCIEAGAYARLKNTRTDAERRRVKLAILSETQAASGLGAATCQNALDILEAALFETGMPGYSAPSSPKHFKRNIVIAVATSAGIVLFAILAFSRSDNPGNTGTTGHSSIVTSLIKERVKEAGGKVDGQLRFSIQWNETAYNPNDFDAHCIEPDGNEIYFESPDSRSSDGNLDVDIITPINGKPAVENITWQSAQRMQEGDYIFFVHCFSQNGGRDGFSAEIEFNGQIYPFVHNRELRQDEKVQVAKVNYSATKGYKLEE